MSDRSRPLLSVVIPTLGRAGLERLLTSIRAQASPAWCEILCVLDSYDRPLGATTLRGLSDRCMPFDAHTVAHDAGYHAWGHPQRTCGQQIASGRWLLYSQDDNVFVPGAFAAVRQALWGPRVPHLFQVDTWQCGVIWRQREIRLGNVDADCIVLPNDPGRLPDWGRTYAADLDFIVTACAFYPTPPIWEPTLISRGRPEQPRPT